ncbi:VOC family protein [Campylobacter novaezeelandiae]|uniref:VOC family protein n=1 Tax=Campylobacter novaezeelandiae TaxID=2267891 RepID=UPI00190685B1|nr:VOC family protein [Campylobacter novaezeelandiae]MBK1964669.1 VOC family protein [Campylobacter novaezeelandiae]MBK1993971.1 VOC family protein [Campylobacter novaezeelandiae]
MLNLPIHHIGVATKDLGKERAIFEKLGFSKEAEFIDEAQGVKGEFMIPCEANFPLYRFELLSNLNTNGPLDSYLKNHTKMYHIAYESKNLQKDTLFLTQTGGGIIIIPIMEATYFSKLCFIMMPNHLLIELVELKK